MSEQILVVDDCQLVRGMLVQALEVDGYHVAAVADTTTAWRSIKAERPAVVILDIELKNENGIDFLNRLKMCESTRDISVIMIAERRGDENVIGALEIGATDYIPKPFSAGVARARVRNVLRVRRIQETMRHERAAAEFAADAKLTFLANMSHEIRTPMTAILGFADLLYTEGEIDKVPKARLDTIRTIQRNGEHLLQLINDILELSKVEAGKLEVDRIRCSACQVAADVVSLMRVRALEKRLQLLLKFDGPMPENVHTDPTRLRQVLLNLVSNAIKFTEEGEVSIMIRLIEDQAHEPVLEFTVSDTGIGIAEDQSEHLFQPFTQATPFTSRQYGGTGLGLAISRQLVELLGGEISVMSEVGVGSQFRFTITTGSLEGVRMVEGVTESNLDLNGAGSSIPFDRNAITGRVLLADDSPDNQRLIGFVLQKSGADVTYADDGQVALEVALAAQSKGMPFEVILMDMQMPRLDGYAATRLLRKQGYTGAIIALTANVMSGDRQKCLDAGCDAYASKPINRKDLVDLVAYYSGSDVSWADARELAERG